MPTLNVREPETFGRVVEAQRLGAPVLGSHVDGLGEVVGEGGALIHPHTDIDAWEEPIESLYNDASRYAELVHDARANAEALLLVRTLQRLEALVAQVRKRGKSCA